MRTQFNRSTAKSVTRGPKHTDKLYKGLAVTIQRGEMQSHGHWRVIPKEDVPHG